jgi:hypothetical protein
VINDPTINPSNNISYITLVDLTLGDEIYRLCDAWAPYELNGTEYMALGSMLSVSGVTTQISTAQTEVTLTVGGITNDANYAELIRNTPIRGGSVQVSRIILTKQQPDDYQDSWIAFRGIINTYAVRETFDTLAGQATLNLVLSCQSIQDFLYAQYRGEITNGADRRRFFPNDPAFDYVSTAGGA